MDSIRDKVGFMTDPLVPSAPGEARSEHAVTALHVSILITRVAN
jgi:hypothetical protein